MAKQNDSVLGRICKVLGLTKNHSGATYVRKPTSKPAVELLEERAVPANFGTVQGWTFIDANKNGILNVKEAGLPGVKVTLIGTDAGPTGNSTISVTAVTSAKGAFTFTNVPEGNYELQTNAVPGLINGAAQTFAGISIASNGQVLRHDFAYKTGLSSRSLSMRQFLTNATLKSYGYSTVGVGTGIADHTPTVTRPAPLTIATSAADSKLDLAANFKDADFTNSQITFNITNGVTTSQIKMTLFDTMTPQTVTNFFNYITAGDYDNSIFHRLTTIANSGLAVLQGGALKLTDATGTALANVTVGPAIKNEFLKANSNTIGTIAMAQSGGDINSATNQFFFNTANNASSLDSQKFAVFGKVTDAASQTALATLAGTTTKDLTGGTFASAHPTSLLNNVPLTGYTGSNATFPTDATLDNYMRITSITVDKRTEFLTYSIVGANGGGNTGVATISITNNFVTIHPVAAGSTTFTVMATDRFGASVTTTIDVTVTGNHAPVASDGSATTDQNTSVNGVLPASDADVGDTLVYSVESQPAKGSVVITNTATGAYTFNPGLAFQSLPQGQTEQVTFTFKATDNHGIASAIKTITVTVNGLNDVPVANDGVAVTDQDNTTTGTLTASDIDGDSFTFSINSQPAKGSVVITDANTGAYLFDPGTDFVDVGEGNSTQVTFTFKATDSHGGDSIGKTITVTVNGINDLPIANAGALSTDPNTPVDGFLTASDPDVGDTIANYTLVSQPLKGSVLLTDAVTGAFTFDPGTDFSTLTPGQSEQVDFLFNAIDNHGAISVSQMITVTVTA